MNNGRYSLMQTWYFFLQIVDQNNLEKVEQIKGPVVFCVAAWFGKVRLIDNMEINLWMDVKSNLLSSNTWTTCLIVRTTLTVLTVHGYRSWLFFLPAMHMIFCIYILPIHEISRELLINDTARSELVCFLFNRPKNYCMGYL